MLKGVLIALCGCKSYDSTYYVSVSLYLQDLHCVVKLFNYVIKLLNVDN